jgi:hypothetical protein
VSPPTLDHCRSCGADVIFVPSAKSGKPMILDAKPEKRIVLVVAEGTGGSHNILAIPEIEHKAARIVDTYTDHHATCPAAKDWKGRHR